MVPGSNHKMKILTVLVNKKNQYQPSAHTKIPYFLIDLTYLTITLPA